MEGEVGEGIVPLMVINIVEVFKSSGDGNGGKAVSDFATLLLCFCLLCHLHLLHAVFYAEQSSVS